MNSSSKLSKSKAIKDSPLYHFLMAVKASSANLKNRYTSKSKIHVILHAVMAQIELNIVAFSDLLKPYNNYNVPWSVTSVVKGVGPLHVVNSGANEISHAFNKALTNADDKAAANKAIKELLKAALGKSKIKLRDAVPILTLSSIQPDIVQALLILYNVNMQDPAIQARLQSLGQPDNKGKEHENENRNKKVLRLYLSLANIIARNFTPEEQFEFVKDLIYIAQTMLILVKSELAKLPQTAESLMPFLNPKALETSLAEEVTHLKLVHVPDNASSKYRYRIKDSKEDAELFDLNVTVRRTISNAQTKCAKTIFRLAHLDALTRDKNSLRAKMILDALKNIDGITTQHKSNIEQLKKIIRKIQSRSFSMSVNRAEVHQAMTEVRRLVDADVSLNEEVRSLSAKLSLEEKEEELNTIIKIDLLCQIVPLQMAMAEASNGGEYQYYIEPLETLEESFAQQESSQFLEDINNSVTMKDEARYDFLRTLKARVMKIQEDLNYDLPFGRGSSLKSEIMGRAYSKVMHALAVPLELLENKFDASQPDDAELKKSLAISAELSENELDDLSRGNQDGQNESESETSVLNCNWHMNEAELSEKKEEPEVETGEKTPPLKNSLSLSNYNASTHDHYQGHKRSMSQSTALFMATLTPEEKRIQDAAVLQEKEIATALYEHTKVLSDEIPQWDDWYKTKTGFFFAKTPEKRSQAWFKDPNATIETRMSQIQHELEVYNNNNFIIRFFKRIFFAIPDKQEWLEYQSLRQIAVGLPPIRDLQPETLTVPGYQYLEQLSQKQGLSSWLNNISFIVSKKLSLLVSGWKNKIAIISNGISQGAWSSDDLNETVGYFKSFYNNEALSIDDMIEKSETILKGYYLSGNNERRDDLGNAARLAMIGDSKSPNSPCFKSMLVQLKKLAKKPYLLVANHLAVLNAAGKSAADALRKIFNFDEAKSIETRQRLNVSTVNFVQYAENNGQTINQTIKSTVSMEKYFQDINFRVGAALSDGDCFFDAVAQALEHKGIVVPGDQYKPAFKRLRELCNQYLKQAYKDFKNNQFSVPNWLATIFVEDNTAEIITNLMYGAFSHEEMTHMNKYERTANQSTLYPVWGSQRLEGRIICEILKAQGINITLQVTDASSYTTTDESGNTAVEYAPTFWTVDAERGFRENNQIITGEDVINIFNSKNHYVPLFRDKSAIQLRTSHCEQKDDRKEQSENRAQFQRQSL